MSSKEAKVGFIQTGDKTQLIVRRGILPPQGIIQQITDLRAAYSMEDAIPENLTETLQEAWTNLHRLFMRGGYIARNGSFMKFNIKEGKLELSPDEAIQNPLFISKHMRKFITYSINEAEQPEFSFDTPNQGNSPLGKTYYAISEYVAMLYTKNNIPANGRLRVSSVVDQFLGYMAHTHGKKTNQAL